MKSDCPVCGEAFEVLRRRSKYPVCGRSGCVKKRQRLKMRGKWLSFVRERKAAGWKPESGGASSVERWKTRALEKAVCERVEGGCRAVIPGVRGCTGEGEKPGVAMSRLIEGLDGWVEMMRERGIALPEV